MANTLFRERVKFEDVQIEGIRHVEPLLKEARKENMKVKLVCEITRNKGGVKMTVGPRMVALDDAFATVNRGNMHKIRVQDFKRNLCFCTVSRP